MRSSDLPHARWHKSSHSDDGADAACVEVAELPHRVALRDSKDVTGPILAFGAAEWRFFLGSVRAGQFD